MSQFLATWADFLAVGLGTIMFLAWAGYEAWKEIRNDSQEP